MHTYGNLYFGFSITVKVALTLNAFEVKWRANLSYAQQKSYIRQWASITHKTFPHQLVQKRLLSAANQMREGCSSMRLVNNQSILIKASIWEPGPALWPNFYLSYEKAWNSLSKRLQLARRTEPVFAGAWQQHQRRQLTTQTCIPPTQCPFMGLRRTQVKHENPNSAEPTVILCGWIETSSNSHRLSWW